MDKLFTPFKVGDTELVNRVVMAPMTRSRATVGDTADETDGKVLPAARIGWAYYYRRLTDFRAGAGLSLYARHL